MNVVSAVQGLKSFSLFKGLSETELAQLESQFTCKTLPKYTTLYEAGDPSDEVFFLFKGTVKCCKICNDGREVIKTILHPITMFGELGLVGERIRHETAITMNEEVHCGTLPLPDFQLLMHSNHVLCLNILELVGKRLLKVEEKLEALIFKDARARIIDFLRESALKIGRKVGYELLFKHSLTQQDIANITGTSRQTVTSVLNDLRKENIIYFNRNTILIRDLAKLS